MQWLLAVAAQSFTANLQIYKKFRSLSPSPSRYSPAGSALQNRLASLDPTADAVPPLMMPRVAQVLGGHSLPANNGKGRERENGIFCKFADCKD